MSLLIDQKHYARQRSSSVIAAVLVSVIYTTVGGLRAVVITDMLQFFMLMGDALFTIGIITIKMGGIREWWPTSWSPNWNPQPFFSFDLHIRAAVVGSIIYASTYWLCTAGSDQMAIQRYLSTRDTATARRSFLITALSQIIIIVLLTVAGMAQLGFYGQFLLIKQWEKLYLPRQITFSPILLPHICPWE